MSDETDSKHMPPKRCEKCQAPAHINTVDLQETGAGQWEVTTHHGYCRAHFEIPKVIGLNGVDRNAKLRK